MRSFPSVPQLSWSPPPPPPPHDPSQQPLAHVSIMPPTVPSALQACTESPWQTVSVPPSQVASLPPASAPSAVGLSRDPGPQAAPPIAIDITRAEKARANGSVPPDMARNVD